jgi:hypothetical protein
MSADLVLSLLISYLIVIPLPLVVSEKYPMTISSKLYIIFYILNFTLQNENRTLHGRLHGLLEIAKLDPKIFHKDSF